MLQRIVQVAKETGAKTLLAGFVKRAAGDWSYEDFQGWERDGAGLELLGTAHPEWVKQLESLARFKSVRELKLGEFLRWVNEGNPELYAQLVADPVVIRWMLRVLHDTLERYPSSPERPVSSETS